ncbi:MAG: hypothetical protein JXR73_21055 [Candidatus Omnitrophica bacterium]|nr:hypothetical protein [Candidatus Omnitrophota bacterium]
MHRNKAFVFLLLSCLCASPAFSQGLFDQTADWGPLNDFKVEGAVDYSDGEYFLEGNGDDIENIEDEGFYIYTEKEGDVSLSAQLEWVEPGTNEWSKLMIMVREKGGQANSKHYSILVRGNDWGDQVNAQYRSSEGGGTSSNQIMDPLTGLGLEAFSTGIYFRISRIVEKNLFVSEWSDDGETWYFAHSATIEMGPSVAYGIAITNHEDNEDIAQGIARDVQFGESEVTLATRKISPTSFIEQETFDVSLEIYNSGDAKTISIEEMIPAGWSAADISNGGSISGETISWSFSAPQGDSVLTYKTTSPADPSERGIWSGTIEGQVISGLDSVFFITQELLDTKVDALYLTNEVILDGELGENEYAGANSYQFDNADDIAPGVWLSGTQYSAEDNNVTFHVFHDDEFIYVGMDVIDPDLDFRSGDAAWRNDATELYMDGNLSRLTTIEQDQYGFQLTVVGDGSWARSNDSFDVIHITDDNPEEDNLLTNGGYAALNGRDSEGGPVFWGLGARAKDDGTGFIVEYRVNKEMILVPPDRTLIGFDILMNGASDPDVSERTSKWGWHTTGDDGTVQEYWNNETGWGLLELLGGPVNVPDWALH